MKPRAWPGLVVATVGAIVASYAFTGDRSYDVLYVVVLVVGLLLMVAGSWWAAVSRAKQGRMGGKAPPPRATARPRPNDQAPAAAPSKDLTRYTLECPKCAHLFSVTSTKAPRSAACPSCGHAAGLSG